VTKDADSRFRRFSLIILNMSYVGSPKNDNICSLLASIIYDESYGVKLAGWKPSQKICLSSSTAHQTGFEPPVVIKNSAIAQSELQTGSLVATQSFPLKLRQKLIMGDTTE